ncbi:dimethylarginine dimethylaminohydrolase family protein [Candidatus Binatus sp.]|uniref:dimethylarginine dimethylaminohydrolase family protein n=2 Tax=Candidatus Binatus sp. TaxID=2811406 RepID=UPI003C4DA1B9
MGDPQYFSVKGGANPHTRNILGLKKRVDPDRARRQWHTMARTLLAHGAEVLVVEPHELLPGLVYPANAGFLYPREGIPAAWKVFHLANLLPSRAPERDVYRSFIRSLGFVTNEIEARFEGEADFFPAGAYMLFTHGPIERQRFVLTIGLPPWKRLYGFRSDDRAIGELGRIAAGAQILSLELCLEAHYHGDTVLCSFGPRREFVLAHMDGLTRQSGEELRNAFASNLVELQAADAALYAANSFQVEYQGKYYLFMPLGVGETLCQQIRERGVEPVLIDVSEFLAKGGGSIKCMILDLGPSADQPKGAEAASFRAQRSYGQLFEMES